MLVTSALLFALSSAAFATPLAPAVIPPAPFSVPISHKVPRRRAKSDALANCQGLAILNGANLDFEYLVNTTIGGQSFNLVIDSGSSDTWVPNSNFTCVDATGSVAPQSTCALGSTGFDPSASKTFQALDGVSFNITYGSGEFVAGPMGLDTVSVGGVSVRNQVVATPTVAHILGDGQKSGILGLAFPDETSMFNVSDPTTATAHLQNPYDPFFFTAVKQNKVKHPYFSVALNRGSVANELNSTFDANLGYLAFGGHAPVPVVEKTSTTVPVQSFVASSNASAKFFWYAVTIDSYNFPGSESVPAAANGSFTPGVTVLDTGTAINIVPGPVAAAYAASFNPPATLTTVAGLRGYIVDCNATVPEFSITIGGQNFSMDARDQVFPVIADTAGDLICVLGTQSSGGPSIPGDFFLLGDTFLHNVVTTFNPMNKQVTLTQRETY
ncbi:acid protease [Mycena amicta]|nr:acid protease [Mycena amicta]